MSNTTNEFTNTHIKWKQVTKGLLQRKGLWEIIRSMSLNNVTVEGQKALGYIKKDLDISGHETINGIDTPYEAWMALETNFRATYASAMEVYECELQRFQWNGCDLEQNYKHFLSLREMYIGCGGTQTAIAYGNYFLRGMNIREIESTKHAMMGMNKTLEEIMARCRIVLAQIKLGSANDGTAYTAKSTNGQESRNSDYAQARTCFKCKKTGHMKWQCPEGGYCNKCERNGHDTNQCRNGVNCTYCNIPGHDEKDCQKEEA